MAELDKLVRQLVSVVVVLTLGKIVAALVERLAEAVDEDPVCQCSPEREHCACWSGRGWACCYCGLGGQRHAPTHRVGDVHEIRPLAPERPPRPRWPIDPGA